jgi:hypothetical protein
MVASDCCRARQQLVNLPTLFLSMLVDSKLEGKASGDDQWQSWRKRGTSLPRGTQEANAVAAPSSAQTVCHPRQRGR